MTTTAAAATAFDHREVTELAQRLMDNGFHSLALAIVSAVEADKDFLKAARERGLLGGLGLGIDSIREQAEAARA
jgi:hypothetical protein